MRVVEMRRRKTLRFIGWQYPSEPVYTVTGGHHIKRVSSRQEVIHVSRTSGSSGQLNAPSDDRAESTQLSHYFGWTHRVRLPWKASDRLSRYRYERSIRSGIV